MLIDFWLRQENNYPFFAQNEKSFVSKIWGRESFNRIRQALLWQKLANTFNTFRNTLPASCCRCWCFYLKIQRKPNPGSQDYFPKLIFIMKCWFVPGGANYFEFICTGCIQAELFARLPHSILCIISLLAGFTVFTILKWLVTDTYLYLHATISGSKSAGSQTKPMISPGANELGFICDDDGVKSQKVQITSELFVPRGTNKSDLLLIVIVYLVTIMFPSHTKPQKIKLFFIKHSSRLI